MFIAPAERRTQAAPQGAADGSNFLPQTILGMTFSPHMYRRAWRCCCGHQRPEGLPCTVLQAAHCPAGPAALLRGPQFPQTLPHII